VYKVLLGVSSVTTVHPTVRMKLTAWFMFGLSCVLWWWRSAAGRDWDVESGWQSTYRSTDKRRTTEASCHHSRPSQPV